MDSNKNAFRAATTMVAAYAATMQDVDNRPVRKQKPYSDTRMFPPPPDHAKKKAKRKKAKKSRQRNRKK